MFEKVEGIDVYLDKKINFENVNKLFVELSKNPSLDLPDREISITFEKI